MRNFILSIALIGCLAGYSKSQDADTIVKWHTLKVVSNYTEQLKELQPDEHLIVWVGYTDFDLWQKLQNGNNCYIDSLPGVRQGILIGKGVANGHAIQEAYYDPYTLTSKTVQDRLVDAYISRPKASSLSIEEQLLGSGTTILEIKEESEVQLTQTIQVEKPIVKAQQFRAPIGHTHTCAAGHTWDHVKNPGHNCQKCGRSQYIQDPFPRPVPLD
jgi:hypothetical protein